MSSDVRARRLGVALSVTLAWLALARAAQAQAEAPAPRPASAGEAAPAAEEAARPGDEATSPGDERGLVGRAGPPTRAATGPTEGAELRAGMEVFGQYAYRSTIDEVGETSWFHEFQVPRIHGAIDARAQDVHGRVVIEGVRSASEGALIGVAGNSLILRLREGYGAYEGLPWLSVAAGLVPTLAVPELEGTWMLRAVTPTSLEETGLYSPVDVGVKGKLELPGDYGWVGIAAYNGEGYTNRELNRGKNVELGASVHPAPGGPVRPLAVFLGYTQGSTGTGLARADRATGGLLWQGDTLRAGVSATYGWGLADDGSLRTLLFDGFVNVRLLERLIIAARGWLWQRDTAAEESDELMQLTGAVGWQVAEPMQTFLAYTRSIPSAAAEAALPGTDYHELRLIGRVVF